MTCILDSSALLAVIRKENGSDEVETILSQKPEPLIHAINYFEVQYKIQQLFPEKISKITLSWLKEAPLTIVKLLTPQITDYARALKAKHRLSLADSIGLGLAKFMNYTFITADRHELESISKKEKVSIHFIR